jgi:hypothetical protein
LSQRKYQAHRRRLIDTLVEIGGTAASAGDIVISVDEIASGELINGAFLKAPPCQISGRRDLEDERLLSSLTSQAPNTAMLRRAICAYSSGVPVRRLLLAILGRSLTTCH